MFAVMKINKTYLRRFVAFSWIVALCGITINSLTYTSGGPAARTNAPNEGNCTSCHSGSLVTSGTNYDAFTFSGNFFANGYLPDSTYTVTVKQRYSGIRKFGFQMTCLNSNNRMAGSISAVNNRTQRSAANVNGATREYINHSSGGTSGTDSISWEFEWTAPSSNVGTVTFYGVVNATNNNNGSNGDVIIAKSFNVDPSDSLPRATASANNTNVCVNRAINLSGSSTANATSWRWSIPNGSPNTLTTQNGSVTFANPGTYWAILTSTNSFGSSAPDSLRITVSDAPNAIIFEDPINEICPGDSFQLSASFIQGASYLWSNNATGNSIWVKDTGTYTVSVSQNGCARESNAVQVRFKNKPNPSLWSDAMAFGDSSCSGNFLTLVASPSGEKTYEFIADDTVVLQSSNSDTLRHFFTANTKYSVRIESNDECWSDTVSYQVFTREALRGPEIECDVNSTTSVSFKWMGYGHKGFQISTDSGNMWFDYQQASYTINNTNPSQKHLLMVRQYDAPPCDFSEVSVKECAAKDCELINYTLSFDSSICLGGETTIEVNGLDNNPGYLIDFNGTLTRNTSFLVSPIAETRYRIGIRDTLQDGCPEEVQEANIIVDRISSNFIRLDKPSGTYCEGEPVTITANDTLDFFEFYSNSSLLFLGRNHQHTTNVLENGDSLWIIVRNGACTDTSERIIVSIVPTPNSDFTYEREGSIYTFNPENSNYSIYNWDFGNGNFSTDIQPTQDFKDQSLTTVEVKLEVEDGFGCLSENIETIDIPDLLNILSLSGSNILIYPNPSKDKLFLRVEGSQMPELAFVYDLQGRLLIKSNIASNPSIDVSNLVTGNYLLVLDRNGEKVQMIFTKQ